VSGAHLSNMLSATPSRQPGEDFRRKVAAHWGISYAQLEATALGEDLPTITISRNGAREIACLLPNLSAAVASYDWAAGLPLDLRPVVREQARQHYGYVKADLPAAEWQRVLAGLEREALALVARQAAEEEPSGVIGTTKTKKRVRVR
jgi:hypothetical protein